MEASKTHFGFTNMGSEMHIFRVIAIWNSKLWFGSPCTSIVRIYAYNLLSSVWNPILSQTWFYFIKPHDLSIFYSTKVNLDSPMAVKNSIDGQALNVYLGKSKIQCWKLSLADFCFHLNNYLFLGSSPKPFCPSGRTDDLSILIHAITNAEKYINVAVADYAPMNVFGKVRKPWFVLDDLLREGDFSTKNGKRPKIYGYDCTFTFSCF